MNKSTFVAAAVAASAAGNRVDIPTSGTLDVTDCYSGKLETLPMSGTDFAAIWSQTGIRRSNVPGGAFDKMSLRAVGMLWSAGGSIHGHGAWTFLDARGDKVFAESDRLGGAITWKFTGGTGMYEGITGAGEYRDFEPLPQIAPDTYQQCPVATGKFEINR